ncbi:VirB4 family type IV secretion system protein [Flexithrix dorotheae]|uniref:VirB4 family type IV secretion system protein n=1 Tax=Flexithrix dorotheae TaxID=70993 RepID=UPI00036FAEE9|nr:TraG family conjugative transposon ATPase [Flexithrix dorotheae]
MSTNTIGIKEIFPLLNIEDHQAITKDGRVALGFELLLPAFESLDAHQYNKANDIFRRASNNLPNGTIIHRQDIFFEDQFESNQEEEGFFKGKSNYYFFERKVLRHKGYLFLSFAKEENGTNGPDGTIFSVIRKFKNPLLDIETRKASAEDHAKAFINQLTSIPGLAYKRLNNAQIEQVSYNYFNLDFLGQPGIFYKNITNKFGGITIGEQDLNVVTLHNYGDTVCSSKPNENKVESGFIDPLTVQLPFPHIVNHYILVTDSEKELQKIEMQVKLLNAFGGNSSSNETKQEQLENFIREVRANGQKLNLLHLNVMVFHNDTAQLKNQVYRTVQAFSKMNDCGAMVESFDTGNLFWAAAPFNCGNQFRWLLNIGEINSAFINFNALPKTEYGLRLCNRLGHPIELDLWHKRLINRNRVMVAPSGAGKSFTVNKIVSSAFENGEIQVIIDVGRSYEETVQLFDGIYYEFTENHPLEFNPFTLEGPQGQFSVSDEHLHFLLDIFQLIWKQEGEIFTKEEKVILKTIVQKYYQWAIEMDNRLCMESFGRFIENYKNQDFKSDFGEQAAYFDLLSFSLCITPFTRGEYSYLMNATHDLDIFSKKLVCFEMGQIKDNQLLYSVVSLLIAHLVKGIVKRFPLERKSLIMDEFWDMADDRLGAIMERNARQWRKENGATMVITQGTAEIAGTKAGQAIISNASTLFVLNHSDKPNLIPGLQKDLGLTDHENAQIKSIDAQHQENGREIFIKMGNVSNVYLVEVSPEERLAYSSKKEDKYAIKTALGKTGKITSALDQVIAERDSNNE